MRKQERKRPGKKVSNDKKANNYNIRMLANKKATKKAGIKQESMVVSKKAW